MSNINVDIEMYAEGIRYLAENKKTDMFLNDGEEHAKIVFLNLFTVANKDIRIFAEGLCSSVPNNPEYISALQKFLAKNGCLHILLENKPKLDTPLYEMLKDFKDSVKIKVTKRRPRIKDEEINFCAVDDFAYRIETDKASKESYGCFNDKKQTSELNRAFDLMYTEEDVVEVIL